MKFEDVLNDIEKLTGLKLSSIRQGAEIALTGVDWDSERVRLVNARGSEQSRSFAELESVWTALCKEKAIHVDSVLRGSGSSRNQPETIFANLPYVEWFHYARKKHIALVRQYSHDFGTLKKMDSIAVEELKRILSDKSNIPLPSATAQAIVVSGDPNGHSEILEQISGLSCKALRRGVYEFSMPALRLLVLSEESAPPEMRPGTYLVFTEQPLSQSGKTVEINKQKYILQENKGLCALYLIK